MGGKNGKRRALWNYKKINAFLFLAIPRTRLNKICTHRLTHTHTHKATLTHTRPPASPVYVLTSPRHHSLYCVHPASRPNELSVYLTLAAGKRGGEVTNQSRTDRGKQRSGKGGEAVCKHLPAIERLEQRAKKKKNHSVSHPFKRQREQSFHLCLNC